VSIASNRLYTRYGIKHMSILPLVMATAATISGCASIVTGQDQIISVDTPLCPAAKCKLQNEEGVYWIPSTPGTVSVDREYGDMMVTCSKQGFQDVMLKVSSSTKGMAFGNILAGGIIGAGVDMGTGAAYDYPSEVIVPLDCRTGAEKAAAPTSGSFGVQAAKLVDTTKCEQPQFAFMDSADEIYKSRCQDGKTGVIKCNSSGCAPLNISSPANPTAPASTPEKPPVHEVSAIQAAKAQGCKATVKLVNKTITTETFLANCEDGSSRVVNCEFSTCTVEK